VSAESVMNEVAMVKAYIDVKDVKESIDNKEVPINVYDSQGNDLNVNIEPENAEVSVDVDHPSKTVPLHVERSEERRVGKECRYSCEQDSIRERMKSM